MKQKVTERKRCKAEKCNQFITMNGFCKIHWIENTLDIRAKAKLEEVAN